MTDESQPEALRQFLILDYDELKSRLTRRLGSIELASDVLHETYLRLGGAGPAEPVRSPKLYVLRAATNIALKRLRRESRFVSLTDAKSALGITDDAPDPAKVVEARLEIEVLRQALKDLTPRQREILLSSRLDNVPLRDIAARLGISQRMVEIELRRALAFCALRLDREIVQRFGPRPGKDSKK
ncbi:MAG: RNA polymerase sigma factor [Pseudomonadota bacterium]